MLGRSDVENMRRRVLAPLGYNLDVEFDPNRPDRVIGGREQALLLVSFGFDLLMRISAPDAVPALKSGARRRGSRLVRRDIVFGGGNASIFLVIALSELLVRTGEGFEWNESGGQQDPGRDVYRALGEIVRDFFSIKVGQGTVVPFEVWFKSCMTEFRVLRQREPNAGAKEGDEHLTTYNAMLLEGKDPDLDPAVVEEQRRYARDYFVNRASLQAIRLSLDATRRGSSWDSIEADMLDLPKVDASERKVSAQHERTLAAWREGAGPYLEYARLVAAQGPRPVPSGDRVSS